MMMIKALEQEHPLDPWALIWGQPHIDSRMLAAALENDLGRDREPDFRTRLLVRDAARALRSFWGTHRFSRWLRESPAGEKIRAVLDENLGEVGFPSIRERLVDSISATQIKQILDLLGERVHKRL